MTFNEPFKNPPDDNKDQLRKFGQALGSIQAMRIGGSTHGACPKCGYCASCGRSNPERAAQPYKPHPLETPFWSIPPVIS